MKQAESETVNHEKKNLIQWSSGRHDKPEPEKTDGVEPGPSVLSRKRRRPKMRRPELEPGPKNRVALKML